MNDIARLSGLSLCTLCLLACPGVATAQPKGSGSEEDERTRVYQEGVDLAGKNQWKEALEKFERVNEIRKAPKSLFTMAQGLSPVNKPGSAKRAYGEARAMALKAGDSQVAEASA